MEAKANVIISLFFMFALLVMNTTATTATLDKTLPLGTVTWNTDTNSEHHVDIEKYHHEPGLFCRTQEYITSGYGLPLPTKSEYFKFAAQDESKSDYSRVDCVLLKDFAVDQNAIFGKAEDDKWYVIDLVGKKVGIQHNMISPLQYIMENVSHRDMFLQTDQNKAFGEHFLALAKKSGTIPDDAYNALKDLYPESTVNHQESQAGKLTLEYQESQCNQNYYWYAIIILCILVLVLLAIIVHMSFSQDSNINGKFKIGDRVKVRNTKQQEWRTGVVKQSLKVEVDGWQKAHTWNHVQHIEPVLENTESHGELTPESNDSSKNRTKKEPNNNDRKAKKDEIDDKTESDSMNYATEDDTMTPSDGNTETEETEPVNTTTNATETNTNSDSVESSSRT